MTIGTNIAVFLPRSQNNRLNSARPTLKVKAMGPNAVGDIDQATYLQRALRLSNGTETIMAILMTEIAAGFLVLDPNVISAPFYVPLKVVERGAYPRGNVRIAGCLRIKCRLPESPSASATEVG